jgi:hypothetical protein
MLEYKDFKIAKPSINHTETLMENRQLKGQNKTLSIIISGITIGAIALLFYHYYKNEQAKKIKVSSAEDLD